MKKNIFLTGAPSSGKTTVIKKIISRLEHPAVGFYTEEERKAYGNFKMVDIVMTMHYVGKKRAQVLLEESKVTSKRRLKALISSKPQTERFLKVIESK